MKKIEIITHCQSIERGWYSSLLTYQLSSLVLHPPKNCEVSITVFSCKEDEKTQKVLRYFEQYENLYLRSILLDAGDLGRRSIGRNLAALQTKADIVWFTDVDYTFGEGCLDAVAAQEWPEKAVLGFVEYTSIHKDHDIGDKYIETAYENPQLLDVNVDDFVLHEKHIRPIGGIQIVQGDFAREHGYCKSFPETRKPIPDGTFASCTCDLVFRRECRRLGGQISFNIPSVYRLRHPARNPKHRRKEVRNSKRARGAYDGLRKQTLNMELYEGITELIPAGASVMDYGAGQGVYVRKLREDGYDANGYDGIPDIEKHTKRLVQWGDLSKKWIAWDTPNNQWGMCIEVGEHIPAEYESIVFDNLSNTATDGLIVSWAGIGQRGKDHVNCHSPIYIANQFGLRGWKVDEKDTMRLRSHLTSKRGCRDRLMVLRKT